MSRNQLDRFCGLCVVIKTDEETLLCDITNNLLLCGWKEWSRCLKCNWWLFDTGLHINHLSWKGSGDVNILESTESLLRFSPESG